MINKLIIDEQNVELTDKSQVPYTHTFAQAQTHVVRYGLDSGDEICAYAFQDCKDLKYIEFPSQIKKIKRGAFKGCTSLKKVPISNNIEYIGKEAFDGCNALEEIEFEASNPPAIYCKLPANTNIYVPDGQKYERIAYSNMVLDGNTEYFTENEWSHQFEKMYDVTFANEEGSYFINKWAAVADDKHTIEEKNRVPVTGIEFDRNIAVIIPLPDEGGNYDNESLKFRLSYTISPENTTNTQLYWYSNDEEVFTIETKTGKDNEIWLKPTTNVAKRNSRATLTAYSESGVKATSTITLR